MSALLSAIAACDTSVQITVPGSQESATFPAPDGIDPTDPCVERSTTLADFDGIETIRLEIPTGRVTVSQSGGSSGASLKVTEIIVIEGLGHEALAGLHTDSTVTTERSFVDSARLDIEATVATGLADEDVVFDVRLVIPKGANVEVFLGNGPVEVSDVNGNVEIHTANGAVTVDHVNGNVAAHTSNRDIQAINVVGNVQAETAEADITMRLAPPLDGEISATTTNGDISLTIAKTTAANMSLLATDGIVTANLSAFDVSSVATASGLLAGVLNGGGSGRIEARTTSGEITFTGM